MRSKSILNPTAFPHRDRVFATKIFPKNFCYEHTNAPIDSNAKLRMCPDRKSYPIVNG